MDVVLKLQFSISEKKANNGKVAFPQFIRAVTLLKPVTTSGDVEIKKAFLDLADSLAHELGLDSPPRKVDPLTTSPKTI